MEIDEILAKIIINEFSDLSPSRVVLYGQNYKAPKDGGLYIVISTGDSYIVGSLNKFDEDTLEEVKSVTFAVPMKVELTSRDRTAYERKEEVIMAITSQFGEYTQQENNCRFFRSGNIKDLTFIEASSSLYRFNIPIVGHYLKVKRSLVEYYENYRANENIFQRK